MMSVTCTGSHFHWMPQIQENIVRLEIGSTGSAGSLALAIVL